MNEQRFNELSNVRGFNNLNGENYVEHIIIQLKDDYKNYDESIFNLIKNCQKGNDALSILDNNDIRYTHNYIPDNTPEWTWKAKCEKNVRFGGKRVILDRDEYNVTLENGVANVD